MTSPLFRPPLLFFFPSFFFPYGGLKRRAAICNPTPLTCDGVICGFLLILVVVRVAMGVVGQGADILVGVAVDVVAVAVHAQRQQQEASHDSPSHRPHRRALHRHRIQLRAFCCIQRQNPVWLATTTIWRMDKTNIHDKQMHKIKKKGHLLSLWGGDVAQLVKLQAGRLPTRIQLPKTARGFSPHQLSVQTLLSHESICMCHGSSVEMTMAKIGNVENAKA